MKVICASFSDGFDVVASLLGGLDCEKVSLVKNQDILAREISCMGAGDVFIASLTEMIPCGIHDFEEAAEYITSLDQESLPEGAHAYLIDLAMLHTDPRVLGAVSAANGRIYLQAGPMTVEELIPQLERWLREQKGSDEHAS